MVLLAIVLAIGVPIAHGALAFWLEYRGFASRRWVVPRPADAASLGLLDVAFASRDGTPLRGWLVAPRNGATVVLCHGSGGDRRVMLDEARALVAGGFGVLLFDLPGHGESMGRVTYGATERAALQGALDFLGSRPDVDPARIGALGHSMGGYTLAQVAAVDPRVRAVVLTGTAGDAEEQTRAEYRHAGRVAQWGALLALRVRGMRLREMRPVDVVAAIAPRPLLVIAGTADETVPARLSRQLYDAAGRPSEFWLIEGAGHGGYGSVDGRYGARLCAFFLNALVGPGAASPDQKTPPPAKRHVTPRPSAAP